MKLQPGEFKEIYRNTKASSCRYGNKILLCSLIHFGYTVLPFRGRTIHLKCWCSPNHFFPSTLRVHWSLSLTSVALWPKALKVWFFLFASPIGASEKTNQKVSSLSVLWVWVIDQHRRMVFKYIWAWNTYIFCSGYYIYKIPTGHYEKHLS